MHEIQSKYSSMLAGYLRYTLRDQAAAEEVQQQVMLEVWQRAEHFDPSRGSIRAWVMTIARSRAIDHLRRAHPEPRDPQAAIALIDRADRQDDPAEDLVEQWHLAHLLTRLPREEAQLLRMRFHESLSQSEIAELSGIPLGTVKMRMVSALARMRELIESEL